MSGPSGAAYSAFIEKWRQSAAAERANKDSFLNDLCAVLGVPAPNPTTGNAKRDDYVFEKAIVVAGESGKTTKFIDLYKRGSFVLEAKQGSESSSGKLGTAKRDTPTWNVAMNAAFGQAIGYATALDEPPPFVLVTDIGYCLDVYASFDGTARYRPFPDALNHRFHITRLAEQVDILRKIFLEPLSLDPSKLAVEVTRGVAGHLADLTKRLEKAGHAPQIVADFLMRCIFTMFAEDVGLLPEEVFTKALKDLWIESPHSFPLGVETLWRAMNEGSAFGFFGKLLHFNGGLFKSPAALPLDKEDLKVLLTAAKCSWNKVEPAIFGALFEGALDKKERHSLGAHFTPRAYVERLVRPTIEEPVREDWDATQAKIRGLASTNKIKEAKAETRAFLKRLSQIRVLDPACGTANFLYVALDLLKAIEDEAFALLLALEGGQTELCLDAPEVTPKQFLGIEINPRAKAIAELVLWIGYLQWRFRTNHRGGKPREPVLADYRNIEHRDSVLAYDDKELLRDERSGKPLAKWDGETFKKSPLTGRDEPDEAARVLLFRHLNPQKAEWPGADFIVGNPPFLGSQRMRSALGDGYVEALRATYPHVPESSDLVLYWWDRAAELVSSGAVRRAGLITTNSITQPFGRRIVQRHMTGKVPVSLLFAVPDHPWVDNERSAAVRIAMTVMVRGNSQGSLVTVASEKYLESGEAEVVVKARQGAIDASLRVGASSQASLPLQSNALLASQGVILCGSGFQLSREDASGLGLGSVPGAEQHIRPYVNGQDFASGPRDGLVLDFHGLTEEEVLDRFPAAYQWLLERVKPVRASNPRPLYRNRWWIFCEPRSKLRAALRGTHTYAATLLVSKHHIFHRIDSSVVADARVVVVALADTAHFGVLQSRAHKVWALASGGRQGVGNDPVYNTTRCFDPFPFPTLTSADQKKISGIAERLDGHRKSRQQQFPSVTFTDMYNVLEKLCSGDALSEKDHAVNGQAFVSVLKKLHEDLDAAVLDAYGWSPDLTDEQLLSGLVELNATRVEEEHNGLVRWLRPDYQQVRSKPAKTENKPKEAGPGLKKSAPPKGPGIATARSAKIAPRARRKSGSKR